MKGYIGVTSYEWWNYLKDKDVPKINFWRKKNTFRVLDEGDYFFFLKKNEPGKSGERAVVGYAEYVHFECLEPHQAWAKYTKGNGYPDEETFLGSIVSTLSADNLQRIGCIILKNYKAFENPVYLSNVGIEFASNIVSGKTITLDECSRLLGAQSVKKNDVVDINVPLEPLSVVDDNGVMKVICGNCKYLFIKASRCPECGQLIKH